MNIKRNIIIVFLGAFLVLFISQCKPEDPENPEPEPYQDEPYSIQVPNGFIAPIKNPKNPLTVNGVKLGRKLFYDPILSGDNTQSCASCHDPSTAFSDAPNQFSKGIDGIEGDKNSMSLVNLAWNRDFFWDGRSSDLETQVLEPVPNAIEMHLEWKEAMNKMQASTEYPALFKKAFGTEQIDSNLTARAIAQFLKTIVSSNSKFQKNFRFIDLINPPIFTQDEREGFKIFMSPNKGDCFHCHPTEGLLFTDNFIDNPVQRFHNNGLDPEAPAGVLTGRGLVTGKREDNGKFKSPTLLNAELTPPYMHDGRFSTLEEVVDFYNEDVHMSSTLDFNMMIKDDTPGREFVDGKRKLGLSELEKRQLVAFLKTLTDPTIATNPAFSKP